MPTTQPNLGYNKPSEATIDQANIAMRAMPWYQEQMRAWGQDPGHPTISKSQSQQILRMAQANGYVVNEGDMEVDDHGNFNPKGHKLRNTLIVAGLAAATLATMGAAGVFSGGVGGVEAGVTSGLGSATLPGAGTSIGAGTVGASATGAGSTMAGLLPSTQTVAGSSILPTGLTPSVGGTSALNGARESGNWLSRLMGRGSNPNTDRTTFGDAAKLFDSEANTAATNRNTQGDFTQKYDQLMQQAQTGRNQNESDAMRKLGQTSYIMGGGSKFTPPSLTLNNKTYAPMDLGYGPIAPSDAEKAGAATLQAQLQARLAPGGSYTPQPLTGYAIPGKTEKAAQWGSRALTGLDLASRFFGR